MKEILVTGGSGFVGRHVLQPLLRAGCSVTVVGRGARPSYISSAVDWVKLDILNQHQRDALFESGSYDTLIHLAWETRHGYFWYAPENLTWVSSSLDLLKAFATHGGVRFVGAGTCMEYTPRTSKCCLATAPIHAPQSLYGVAKDAFHRVLTSFAESVGLSYAWGRIFLLFGPHEAPERLVPNVLHSLLREQVARCSSGVQVRDFMHVRDCGSALAALALSEFEGPINICSGNPATIKTVVTKIASFLDMPDKIAFGALPERVGEASHLWGDVKPLRDEVGFQPRFDLESGLRDTVDWWLDEVERDGI